MYKLLIHIAQSGPITTSLYYLPQEIYSQTYMCKHSVDIVWLFPLQKYPEPVSCGGVWGEQACVWVCV